MEKAEFILRKAYPEKASFSEKELDLVRRILPICECPKPKKSRIPRTEVQIGEIIKKGGIAYRCVKADVSGSAGEACSGCDFSRKSRNCYGLRCSPFDRSDKKFVWFVEVNK